MLRDVIREPMLLLLIVATGLYVLLGDRLEASLLAASVLVVIGLTVYQSERSERALRALRELGAPRARVLRDGAWSRMPAAQLVVGDVVEITAGDRIPADGQVLSSNDLQVDESMLTGESVAVDKAAGASDEHGRVQSATLAVRGTAIARVTATGRASAIGRIGTQVAAIRPEPGPIQAEIRRLVRIFSVLAGAASLMVAGLHYWGHGSVVAALLAGITLAIAVVPEEFPVVLAIFTAIGAWRLARAQALVRRLSTLETLGTVDALCTDKTGTLTENRMRVASLEGSTAQPGAARDAELQRLGELAAWAAPAASQEPMDRALADRFGTAPWPVLRQYAFSSRRPAVGQVLELPAGLLLACKGAPEFLAGLCLDAQGRQHWLARTRELARQGLRVLAVAEAPLPEAAFPESLVEARLQWRGLVAFADPLRPRASEAVEEAHAAGIRVLMLTGDHYATANAIAREAGIPVGRVLTGAELESMDDLQLQQAVRETSVFARVLPEHKLRLVRALRAGGSVVAMTGDGVNDAPALAAAHVGIAMGGRGTDVAREAAGLVLLDDDFATIVRGIRLGRQIHDNLRRALRYIVAVHVPIVGMAVVPLLLDTPSVLLPLHLVVLELVIDPACSIVFEREPEAAGLMRRAPEGAAFQLFDRHAFGNALATGAALFAVVAMVYALALLAALPFGQVGALAFTTLLAGNLALIWRYRAGRAWPARGQNQNTAFLAVLASASLALVAATRSPGVAAWFAFQPPPLGAWIVALLAPLPLAAAAKSLDSANAAAVLHRH